MKFKKYQGLGNDFIITDENIPREKVNFLCNRNFGIGADGIIVNVEKNGLPFMLFYNQDGSIATMCGNGIRCYADYLFNKGLDFTRIDTPSGIKNIKRISEELYQVDMGDVSVEAYESELDKTCHIVDSGCRHAIIVSDELNKELLMYYVAKAINIWGKDDVNISIAKKIDDNNIEILTHERGVGITLACGTAACAAVYSMNKIDKLISNRCNVKALGGNLEIEIVDNKAFMTAKATKVFDGEIK